MSDVLSPDTAPPTTDTAPDTAVTGKVFTQAELDQIVKDRLDRQKRTLEAMTAKATEEAQAKALAEQGEFKTLFEKERERAATLEASLKAKERAELVRKAAKAGGLDPDDEDLISRLRGETEDELVADAKKLAERLAPKAPATTAPPPPTPGTPRVAPGPTRPAVTTPTRPERPIIKL